MYTYMHIDTQKHTCIYICLRGSAWGTESATRIGIIYVDIYIYISISIYL